jgi:hypothetical protein
MKIPESHSQTRREALLDTLRTVVVTSLTLPAVSAASAAEPPESEPGFVPENDYPFFGGELPEGYGSIRFK